MQDVMHHVVSEVVPPSLPGSPQWHKNALNDLLCKADAWGMPHLFLTLTADEISELKWEEIVSLEAKLLRFSSLYTWQVCVGNHHCHDVLNMLVV